MTVAAITPQLLQQHQQMNGYAAAADSCDSGGGGTALRQHLQQHSKKRSTASLVNTRAFWPYPSAAAIAAASGGALVAPECQSPGACSSSLEFEALAAVHRLSVAVRDISVSEMLPRTPQLIFVNVTTLEGQPYCLELTAKGWRITSLRTDCMQGDFTRMELFTAYYESVYDLMSVISPSFKQHAAALASSRKSSAIDDDDEDEINSVTDDDGGLVLEDVNAFYNASPKSASRRASLTASASGSRRASLKHAITEPNVLQLCPNCCCASLAMPSGELIADVLVADATAAGAMTAPPAVAGAQMPHAFSTTNAADFASNGALADAPQPCRCGAQNRAHLATDNALEEGGARRFARRRLRLISEGGGGDLRRAEEAEGADMDTSSSDDLKFEAEGGAQKRASRRAAASGSNSSAQPSSSASSRRDSSPSD